MIRKETAPLALDRTKLKLSQIKIDGGTQSRAGLHEDTVAEYAEAISRGDPFPPVVVFYDGENYWLADGFHRYQAHSRVTRKDISVDVRQGSRRDAILFSVGANSLHGLRRNNDDKRRAVQTLLSDTEWVKWSDGEISRQCNVSQPFVSKLRPVIVTHNVLSEPQERTYTTKHGTVAVMNTENIGKPVVSEVSEPDKQKWEEDHSALHQEVRDSLPPEIKALQEAQQQRALDKRKAGKEQTFDGLSAEERIGELEESIRIVEGENEELKAEIKKFSEMRVQYEQGGFEKLIADKDEEIRVLKTRLYTESEDKASWARSSKMWKKRATELGWSNDEIIPVDTEARNG